MNLFKQKRFSIYLMTFMGILVTGSVVFIAGTLYIYFGKRLDSEFNKKILAQKGQIEIIIKNRIAEVNRRLNNLCTDNTIRFTMMISDISQLNERLKQYYPAKGSVYFYVKKNGQKSMHPASHPGLSQAVIDFALSKPIHGEVIEKSDQKSLLWRFEAPIMHQAKQMGTGYALYDMIQDQNLIQTITKMVDGDISMKTSKGFHSLTSNAFLPLPIGKSEKKSSHPSLPSLYKDLIFSKIDGFKNLYFIASRQSLLREKKNISLLIGIFSIFVLAVSASLSVVLGRQMAYSLGEMATKAIQISKGKKDIFFEKKHNDYWELIQLSQAFNYMLINLKNAEEKSRYNQLLENVDDAVYLIDRNGKILEANESTYKQLGYQHENFFNLKLFDFVPEKDVQFFLDQLKTEENDIHQGKKTFETYHMHNDGAYIPVEINSRAITYRGQKVILNVARDISERRNAEKALRESEERFRSVIEHSHDGILILDDGLKIIYANNELCRILGYSRTELTGINFREFLDNESLPILTNHHDSRCKDKEFQDFYQLNIVRKDGANRRCKIIESRIKDTTKNVKILIHLIDYTDIILVEKEKKQLEAQLIQAQKLEAIGTLAGGIAHDFNNLLMAIQGRISLMQLHTHPDHPHYTDINEIGNTIKSAAKLTKQLLGFARGGKYEVKPTCINELLDKNSHMYSQTNKEIRIHKKFQKDIWTVEVDPGQIEQVLLNLYVNAWQSMPEGGDLFLQTENVILSDKYCKPFKIVPGKYVKISVTDTGIGMDKKLIKRIFEPFFTTKEIGKGTGLGLASAYGIIKNHSGIIRVYSEKSHGSTFNIYLPALPHVISKKMQPHFELPKGKETILLVDDEEDPIAVGKLMLEELGYKVFLAKSGEEAIKFTQKNILKLDMIILDMIMPKMNGSETYDRLKEINPDIKVLLSSGYNLNRQIEEMIKRGCKGFIQKPFDINLLSQQVREVLDR